MQDLSFHWSASAVTNMLTKQDYQFTEWTSTTAATGQSPAYTTCPSSLSCTAMRASGSSPHCFLHPFSKIHNLEERHGQKAAEGSSSPSTAGCCSPQQASQTLAQQPAAPTLQWKCTGGHIRQGALKDSPNTSKQSAHTITQGANISVLANNYSKIIFIF